MKTNRRHRVPLCGRALEILEAAQALVGEAGPLVFTHGGGKPFHDGMLRRLLRELGVGAVPHGFRSTFRDWAAEETDAPHSVMEAALSHVIRNQVEAAYARSDLFERRRRLMDDWARYLASGSRARRGQRGRRRNAKCRRASLPNVVHWSWRGAPALRTPDRGEPSPGPPITPAAPFSLSHDRGLDGARNDGEAFDGILPP